jgi:serine phosphatase RsbU (regulator of sigma subunit)
VSDGGASPQPPAVAASESPPARFVSLRVRLLGLVMLVLVPWLALVLYGQFDERKAAIAGVKRDAMRVLDIVTRDQAAQIEAARQLLTTLARLPQLRSPAACAPLLAELLEAYSQYRNFVVIGADGNITCSAVPASGPVNVSDRTYFKRAMETRRFAVGDYLIGRITLVPAIAFALPLPSADGRVDSIVVVTQGLSWLKAEAGQLDLPPGATLALTDPNGTVLAHVPPEEGMVGNPLPEKDVLAAFASAPESGVVEADDAHGVRRLWVHAPTIAGVNMGATIGVSREAAFAAIDRHLVRNLLALGVVTILAIAAAWFGGGLMLRQVDALVAATRRLASGDLDARAPSTAERNELDLLARAFNRMAATLQARDRELRIAEEKTRVAEVELAVTRAHLDIAKQIQQSLLPQDPLAVGRIRVAGRCVPAEAVGGDYFGYFPRSGDGVDSFVGDVAGHGVGAALLMAEARTTFLTERLGSSSAADTLAKLNALLYDDLDRAKMFMTACCATFDATKRELSYANAGHPPAILLRSGETQCTTIEAHGGLLGIDKDARFAEATVKLHGGDIVVFYTDGVTERSNATGEFFGADRLNELVVAHRDDTPEAMIDAVFEAVNRFAGAREHEDDLTVVVMKQAA